MGLRFKTERRWMVRLDGQEHLVEVVWDRYASGGGSIRIDGERVQRWRIGLKWPGIERSFDLAGHPAAVIRVGTFCRDVELVVDGQRQSS
jgi:hypothetical protein